MKTGFGQFLCPGQGNLRLMTPDSHESHGYPMARWPLMAILAIVEYVDDHGDDDENDDEDDEDNLTVEPVLSSR